MTRSYRTCCTLLQGLFVAFIRISYYSCMQHLFMLEFWEIKHAHICAECQINMNMHCHCDHMTIVNPVRLSLQNFVAVKVQIWSDARVCATTGLQTEMLSWNWQKLTLSNVFAVLLKIFVRFSLYYICQTHMCTDTDRRNA